MGRLYETIRFTDKDGQPDRILISTKLWRQVPSKFRLALQQMAYGLLGKSTLLRPEIYLRTGNSIQIRSGTVWGPLRIFESLYYLNDLLRSPFQPYHSHHCPYWATIIPVSDVPLDSHQSTPAVFSKWQLERDLKGEHVFPSRLWDLLNHETIILEPGRKVPYTAISYTWGEYRKKRVSAAGTTETITESIPGVPWPVPVCSAFSHTELLIAAEKVSSTRYVWIDVLCIPQNEEGEQECVQEIKKQGGIFLNAVRVVAWLWDLQDIGPLQLFMAGFTVALKVRNCYPGPEQAKLEKEASDLDDEIASISANPFKSAWFSSLWTLQEAILAPGMVLTSRNGDTIIGPNGIRCTPLVLGAFEQVHRSLGLTKGRTFLRHHVWDDVDSVDIGRLALLGCTIGHLRLYMPHFLEQYNTLLQSGISIVGTHSRADIVNIAKGRRDGKVRRQGAAIMSAIDCLDWYDDDHVRDLDKIQARLPTELLQELALKIGSRFYFTMPSVHEGGANPFNYSLLPLNAVITGGETTGERMVWDADSSQWKIQKDYRIFIPSGTYHIPGDTRLEGRIAVTSNAPYLEPPGGFQSVLALQSAIRTQFPGSECVLVPMFETGLIHNFQRLEQEDNVFGVLLIRDLNLANSSDVPEQGWLNVGWFRFHLWGSIEPLLRPLSNNLIVGIRPDITPV